MPRHKERRNDDEALAMYRRALELKPTFSAARGNLAEVLLHRGQNAEAFTEYRRAIALEANNVVWLVNLGVLCVFGPRGTPRVITHHHGALSQTTCASCAGPNPVCLPRCAGIGPLVSRSSRAVADALQLNPSFGMARSNILDTDARVCAT